MYQSMHPDYNAEANHEIIARSEHFFSNGLVSFRGSKAAVEMRRRVWESIGRRITFCSLDTVSQDEGKIKKRKKAERIDLSTLSIEELEKMLLFNKKNGSLK